MRSVLRTCLACLVALSISLSVHLSGESAITGDSPDRISSLKFSGIGRQCSLLKPKGVVVCVHGVGLCSQSYESVSDFLVSQGFDVIAVDVRGFSYPAAPPGQLMDLPLTVEDLKSLVGQLKAFYADTPVILLGESMGANVVLRLVELHPGLVEGVICNAPAGTFRRQKILTLPSFLLSPFLLRSPQRIFSSAIIGQATSLRTLRCHISNSPEHRMTFSLEEIRQFIAFVKESQADAVRISQCRVMLTQGLKDKLANCVETAKLFSRIECDKTLLLLTKEEHLIFEERPLSADARLALIELLDRILNHRTASSSNVEGLIVGRSGRVRKAQRILGKAGLHSYKYVESLK